MAASAPHLSVLIPVFNEAENVPALGEEVRAALAALERPYEVLWIDDGSTDETYSRLLALAKADSRNKVLRLGRNFGQTAAMSAGMKHAAGEVIACLDGDLQNDPKEIPAMLAKMEEGFDVVSGWRKDRKDPWLTRRLPSEIANSIISHVTGVELHDYGCTLKLYRSEYIRHINLYGEMHRFIPAFLGSMGARITEIPVHHRPRKAGKSKYGLMRTFKVILDLLTVKFMDQYMTKPIYLFGGWGLGMWLLGVAFALYTLYKKFFLGIFVKDQPMFQISIFCGLIGFQLILLGLIAEIMIRIYYASKDKPTYYIREKVGF